MTNHELHAVRVRGFHHVVAVGHGYGHGLLAEDVASRRRGVHGDVAMRRVGCHDGHRVAVALVQQRSVVRPKRHSAIVPKAPRLVAVGVGNADKLDLGLPIDQLRRIGAEAAGAYQGNPDARRPGDAGAHDLNSTIPQSPRLRFGNRSARCRV